MDFFPSGSKEIMARNSVSQSFTDWGHFVFLLWPLFPISSSTLAYHLYFLLNAFHLGNTLGEYIEKY